MLRASISSTYLDESSEMLKNKISVNFDEAANDLKKLKIFVDG